MFKHITFLPYRSIHLYIIFLQYGYGHSNVLSKRSNYDRNTSCDAHNDDKYDDKASICIKRSSIATQMDGPLVTTQDITRVDKAEEMN
jgi:hypothetical protein